MWDRATGYMPEAWMLALPSVILVGLTGIFPLLVIPMDSGHSLRHGSGAQRLKLFLSFAAGGLLSDVFLHLLPEAWSQMEDKSSQSQHVVTGLWVLMGLLLFMVIEKMVGDHNDQSFSELLQQCSQCKKQHLDHHRQTTNKIVQKNNNTEDSSSNINYNIYPAKSNQHKSPSKRNNGKMKVAHRSSQQQLSSGGNICHCFSPSSKSFQKDIIKKQKYHNEKKLIKTSGYLNLAANCMDNFTHGLAVGGSFLISPKLGALTTLSILMHEIPHEIGDFAILLKSGFDRWNAALAQSVTAAGGLVGALVALSVHSIDNKGNCVCARWIMPFTAGGFLYIALVSVVPDLITETKPWDSLKQVMCLLVGGSIIGMISLIFDP